MRKNKTFKVTLSIHLEVNTIEFDDDVDWTIPRRVIEDYIECVGWEQFATEHLGELKSIRVSSIKEKS